MIGWEEHLVHPWGWHEEHPRWLPCHLQSDIPLLFLNSGNYSNTTKTDTILKLYNEPDLKTLEIVLNRISAILFILLIWAGLRNRKWRKYSFVSSFLAEVEMNHVKVLKTRLQVSHTIGWHGPWHDMMTWPYQSTEVTSHHIHVKQQMVRWVKIDQIDT